MCERVPVEAGIGVATGGGAPTILGTAKKALFKQGFQAAGIMSEDGTTLNITNSTFSGNVAGFYGGAIHTMPG